MTLQELNDKILCISGVVHEFKPEVNSLRMTASVMGRDGMIRMVVITHHDIVTHGPEYAVKAVIAASNAGAPMPFCIHCGR